MAEINQVGQCLSVEKKNNEDDKSGRLDIRYIKVKIGQRKVEYRIQQNWIGSSKSR